MKLNLLSTSVIAALLLVGCGESSSDDKTPVADTTKKEDIQGKVEEKKESQSSQVVLKSGTRDVSFLVNKDGFSLYTFDKDTSAKSNCDAACKKIWPILSASVTQNTDLGIDSVDGNHTTYLNHPLYTFINDTKAGDVNGDKVKDVWHLVYPQADFNATQEVQVSSAVRTQTYLATASGATLYTFDNDEANKSNCEGECMVTWPIYNADIDTTQLPSGVSASDFATITRADGFKQTTYKEQPLYTFVKDTTVGDVKGDWVKGVWHVIDLASVEKSAAARSVKSVTFSNSGASDYVISATDDSAIATLNASDPTINLTVGKSYTFKVENFSSHPLQLNSESGEVLLAMGSTSGSFETDSGVDFNDDGAGSITFTLTQALADKLAKYRCEHHSGMSGSFSIK